jgi:hypothetical protein
MISYNLMWNKSYLIFILNNYRYDNYLNSNRYNELNVSEGHICNFLQEVLVTLKKHQVREHNLINPNKFYLKKKNIFQEKKLEIF